VPHFIIFYVHAKVFYVQVVRLQKSLAFETFSPFLTNHLDWSQKLECPIPFEFEDLVEGRRKPAGDSALFTAIFA
jgi:hypothetical protein